MLFLLLIGACVSINQDSLQPITSNAPSSSLISIAKTNPIALVEMLDGADPGAINDIVKILRTLIAEGVAEKKKIQAAHAKAVELKKKADIELVRLTGIEGAAQSEYRRRAGIEAQKKGIYDALKESTDAAEPALTNEIRILKKVLGMLNGILDQNTPDKKDLIELGSSEKGKAYLKLLANVQADPAKLKKIIGFVGTLLNEAESEWKDMQEKLAEAKRVWAAATEARLVAQTAWQQAKAAREEQDDVVAEAEGVVEAAKKVLDTRLPVLQSEDTTLKKVIDLLLSTADKPSVQPKQ